MNIKYQIYKKLINHKFDEKICRDYENSELINKGLWGKIYKFNYNIPKGKISDEKNSGEKISKEKNSGENIDLIIKAQKIYEPNTTIEYEIMEKLSDYRIKNNFNHFPYSFNNLVCGKHVLYFMEYIEGETLTRFIEKQKYNDKDINIIKKQMKSITDVLNKLNIHHNDMNLNNIIISNETIYSNMYLNIYLIDYGEAKFSKEFSKKQSNDYEYFVRYLYIEMNIKKFNEFWKNHEILKNKRMIHAKKHLVEDYWKEFTKEFSKEFSKEFKSK